MSNIKTRVGALVLALTLTAALTTACSKRPEPVSSGSTQTSSATSSSAPAKLGEGDAFYNTLPVPSAADEPAEVVETGLSEKASEKHAINPDAIGWLQLPNTTIDDVVMWRPTKSTSEAEMFYYLRKDFDKRYSFEGSYFVDFRSKFDGGRKGMSRNTVIYGHSIDLKDDPNAPLFSQTKKYLNEDFAKANPYINFSTIDEDMVWEVFAVFYATVNLDYNTPDPSDADFATMISEVTKRSIYTYEGTVSASDKVITLSTCIYNIPGKGNVGYPNDYRYVVMAKLVPADAKLKTTATFTKNASPKAP